MFVFTHYKKLPAELHIPEAFFTYIECLKRTAVCCQRKAQHNSLNNRMYLFSFQLTATEMRYRISEHADFNQNPLSEKLFICLYPDMQTLGVYVCEQCDMQLIHRFTLF